MTRSPSVSVAMATCDGGRYVDEQLASIAAQTRPPDQLVVCDDASADDTLQRVARFAEQAAFEVRLVSNAERLGTTRNFEQAVSLCSGDVIFLADQDDVWLEAKIARLLLALEQRPDVGVVFCNGSVTDAAGAPLGYDLWRALMFGAGEQRKLRAGRAPEVFMRHVVAAGTTLAFRARHRERLHPFPELPSTHDAWIAFIVASLAGCAIVPEELIRYRLHAHNQIGLRRFNLLDQYQQAKRQLAHDAFAREASFFSLARQRLAAGAGTPATPELIALIDAKLAHCRSRDAMLPALLARLPAVLREAASGRYWRFAYGARSLAQDLFLR